MQHEIFSIALPNSSDCKSDIKAFAKLQLFHNLDYYRIRICYLSIDERVNDLLSRMTVTEKIKQLDMYRGWDLVPMGQSHEATVYDEALITKTLGNYSVGSIHDFYPAYPSLSNKVQQYVITHSRLGIPVMFIEEGLHGYSGKGSTSFPIPLALSATWDTSLIYKVGRSIATETRADGTNMILGPLLDIARDPRWGRMEETYGEDTYLVSEIGLAMVKGLQNGDVSKQIQLLAILNILRYMGFRKLAAIQHP